MAKDKGFMNNPDPFSGDSMSIQDADAILYGGADVPPSGRVIAKPVSIMDVWANPAQPRRAVPNSLQLYWNGDPAQVSELLGQWHAIANKMSGQMIDVYAVIQGQGQGFDLDDKPAVFVEYIALLRLAASIHKDGLINPITVVKQSDRHMIESGERRWLAYHVLNQYMGDDYKKIPAAKTDGDNYVWRQATENTARRALNPIGMARQLALLIMEARRGIDGQTYDSFEFMCPPGTCDRRYYAQVANGNIHRIPKGMGEKIQNAMGLSMKQLSHYRKLIRLTEDEGINDALWIRADVEDWAEGSSRRIGQLPLDVVKGIIARDEWTLDDLLALEEQDTSTTVEVQEPKVANWQPTPESTLPMGKVETWVGLEVNFTRDNKNGIVISEHGPDLIKVKFNDGVSTVVGRNQVTVISTDKGDSIALSDYYERPPAQQSPSPAPRHETSTPRQAEDLTGSFVTVEDGRTGEVLSVQGGFVQVRFDDGKYGSFKRGSVEVYQPEPSRDAFGQDVRPTKPNPFGKSVSQHLTGDSNPMFDDYWNGILAAVATMAAVDGRANVVGRVQRLRSLTKGQARSMDSQDMGTTLQSAHDDMTGILSDIMVRFNQQLEALANEYLGEVDDE